MLLQNLRARSKGIVAKALIAVLVVSMAAFGIDAFFYDQGSGYGQNPVEINGQPLSQQEIELSVQNYRQQIATQLGSEYLDQLSESTIIDGALHNLIADVLINQQSQDYRLTASDTQVETVISQSPEFRSDGGFNREALQNYLQVNNLTSSQFKANVRTTIATRTLPGFTEIVDFTPVQEKNVLAGIIFEERDIHYAAISYESFHNEVEPTQSDYQQYYQDNAETYIVPEQTAFAYLEIDRNEVLASMAEPEEDAIALAYQERVAELQQSNAYQVSHILISDTERSDEQAKQRANEVMQKIRDGLDFEQLVDEYSDDPVTAETQGSLGTLDLDELLPEFSDQVKLMQVGEISGPVGTDFGYHIIRLDGTPESSIPELNELRDELVAAIRDRNAQNEFQRRTEELSQATYSAEDLATPAQELALELKISNFIEADGSNAAPDSPFQQQQVLDEAFSNEVFTDRFNSQIITLEGKSIVLRLHENKPEKQLTLDEVRNQVQQAVITEQSKEKAVTLANTVIAQLQTEPTDDLDSLFSDDTRLRSISQAEGRQIEWQSTPALTRLNSQLDSELSAFMFSDSLAKNTVQAFEGKQMVYIIAVTDIQQPDFSQLHNDSQTSLQRQLTRSNAVRLTTAMYTFLRDKADISGLEFSNAQQ